MVRLKVGAPLHPGVIGYEQGVHYNYTAGGHTLIMSSLRPTPSEIDNVRDRPSVFAVNLCEEALFLLAKFGDSPWKMAHYNWWLNPPVMRPDPIADLENLNGGVAINACLVNASNGLIEALRAVRLSLEFSFSLLSSVELQARQAFDPWHYLDLVEKTSTKYREGNRVIEEALCVCTGDSCLTDRVADGLPHVCDGSIPVSVSDMRYQQEFKQP
jgi:hypothetical protein